MKCVNTKIIQNSYPNVIAISSGAVSRMARCRGDPNLWSNISFQVFEKGKGRLGNMPLPLAKFRSVVFNEKVKILLVGLLHQCQFQGCAPV